MILSNRKILSHDNELSIDTAPFSDCLHLVEPSKIYVVFVRISYNIGKMDEYCKIVLSQQGREKLVVKVYLMVKDKNRDDLFY